MEKLDKIITEFDNFYVENEIWEESDKLIDSLHLETEKREELQALILSITKSSFMSGYNAAV